MSGLTGQCKELGFLLLLPQSSDICHISGQAHSGYLTEERPKEVKGGGRTLNRILPFKFDGKVIKAITHRLLIHHNGGGILME